VAPKPSSTNVRTARLTAARDVVNSVELSFHPGVGIQTGRSPEVKPAAEQNLGTWIGATCEGCAVLVDLVLRGLPIGEIAERAALVEGLGFDAVGVTETSGNPFLAAAQAAQATSRVRVVTAIALAFPRSPMDLAYTSWDLQALSGGRFALGLGSQVRAHVERRYSAPWTHPAARMRELILALGAIWDAWESGGELDFRGEFYSHTLMPPNFRPPPTGHPRPPVLLAGVRALMTEVAGEVADGFLGHAFCSQDVLRDLTLPALERGLERAGRARGELELTAAVFVALSDEEWEACRRRVAFYGSTPGYRDVLDHHGLGSLHEALHALSRSGGWSEMPGLIDDDVLALFAVRGRDPVAVADAVRRRVEGIADRVGLVTQSTDPTALAAVAGAL
jgi:probable F420-dependent oxidoreductase